MFLFILSQKQCLTQGTSKRKKKNIKMYYVTFNYHYLHQHSQSTGDCCHLYAFSQAYLDWRHFDRYRGQTLHTHSKNNSPISITEQQEQHIAEGFSI